MSFRAFLGGIYLVGRTLAVLRHHSRSRLLLRFAIASLRRAQFQSRVFGRKTGSDDLWWCERG